MGLISEWIEVGLGSKNIKYYEDLGYKIPKTRNKWGKLGTPKGKKIKVKVTDLPKGSHAIVKVVCDCCNKNYEMNYKTYNRNNHNGKIYCRHCNNTILNKGKNNPNYNPNKTDDEREQSRNYPEYTEFIKKVLARDNYTCQCCGQKHNDTQVHHLDSYDLCKEKRTDETNGITLCKSCHKNFHSIYGYGNNTKEQFEEWIGCAIGELKKYDGELPTARKVYCIEENKIYNSTKELAGEWNVPYEHIYKVCNKTNKGVRSLKGKHLLWHDEYLKMSEKDVKDYLEWCKDIRYKKVICLTTNKIFDNLTEAGNYYNCNKGVIGQCCKGKNKSAGKLKDGTKLKWMYLSKWEQMSKQEQQKILDKYLKIK